MQNGRRSKKGECVPGADERAAGIHMPDLVADIRKNTRVET
jgi:hypothetical protein